MWEHLYVWTAPQLFHIRKSASRTAQVLPWIAWIQQHTEHKPEEIAIWTIKNASSLWYRLRFPVSHLF